MPEGNMDSLKEIHHKLAIETNNQVWDLLDKKTRTPQEEQEMLVAVYASLYHWNQVGTAANTQRGYWMLSRVYLALNRPADALDWALKCQEITDNKSSEMEDFDLAFAQEGLARAYAITGDLDQARYHYDQAYALGKQIKDLEDKEIFTNNLKGGNWFHFSP